MDTGPARSVASGVAVAGLLIPEAVAYAAIAGLAPVQALVAAVVGLSVYFALGRSRFAIISPTSSSAAVLAAGLAALGTSSAAERAVLAATTVGIVGCLFILVGALRLGSLASFVSRPVLRGFAFGLAINIVVRQFPTIAGVPVSDTNPFLVLYVLAGQIAVWNWVSVGVGASALGLLIALKRWPAVPGAFVALASFVALTYLPGVSKLHVAQVGLVELSLPHFAWPSLDAKTWFELVKIAFPVAIIVFAESWGTVRTLGLKHGDAVEPNRELLSLGVANLLSGALGGMAAGAGFSGSSANEAAGANSRLSGLITAITVAALVIAAGQLIARTPEPVLAAIVIAALYHALDPSPLVRLWRIDRDQIIAAVAALGVLLLGVLEGMLLAVALSVVALIRRMSKPAIAILGRLGDSQNYADISRHPEAETDPRILILRPGEPFFFANAEAIMGAVERQAAETKCRFVVVSLELTFDLDSTALDVVAESAKRLESLGYGLVMAHLKDPVLDLLRAAGAPLSDLAVHSTRSVAEAVAAISRRLT
jgi:MFS superfamily sulfate permease-like transporter